MNRARKRVLIVSPDLPSPPSWGFGMRVYQLTRHVAAHHSVTLLAYQYPEQDVCAGDLGQVCEDIVLVPARRPRPLTRRARQVGSVVRRRGFHGLELYSSRMQLAIEAAMARQRYDVVQVESSPMMCFDFRRARALVLDEHNVESEMLERMTGREHGVVRRAYNLGEASKYRAHEERAWRQVQGVAVTSERERLEVARRAPGTNAVVVANGVDPDFFAPKAEKAQVASTIVFNGLLSYRPNLDAVRFFLSEVWPHVKVQRPDLDFTVVGSGPESDLRALRAQGAVVTGYVPDIRPYLARAACVVIPIRMGSGTRLKVLEAMSAGAPMVSTSVGCEGIDVRHGEHLLVADDPKTMAAEILRLVDDVCLQERLAAAGRRLAVDRYAWARCAESLHELYEQVSR